MDYDSEICVRVYVRVTVFAYPASESAVPWLLDGSDSEGYRAVWWKVESIVTASAPASLIIFH